MSTRARPFSRPMPSPIATSRARTKPGAFKMPLSRACKNPAFWKSLGANQPMPQFHSYDELPSGPQTYRLSAVACAKADRQKCPITKSGTIRRYLTKLPLRFLFLLIATAALFSSTHICSAAQKPNILFILADDLGYADVGVQGAKHATPNIDKMAAEGMRLTSFYTAANVCTPTRASIMTGCYAKRVGLHENQDRNWVLMPGDSHGISASEITLPQLLKKQGYATVCLGKWHLGDQPEFLPTRHGFDEY